jgi:glutathione peroxidase
MTSVYDFDAVDIHGLEKHLADYHGKVLLIVNVASQCGFTPQYGPLQELYDKYAARGLVILGFPCDQFGHQEPGSEDEIAEFCDSRFGVTFPMFSKIDVNGKDAHPLYQWLKSEKSGLLGGAIKWNFTKFLVDAEGNVVKRYGSTTTPDAIAPDIEELLPDISIVD